MPEEIELIWDDSVAPETCIDFDAPHVSTQEVLATFLGAFGFFFGLYSLISYGDPAKANPVATRHHVIPPGVLNASLALSVGGTIDDEEEDDDDE